LKLVIVDSLQALVELGFSAIFQFCLEANTYNLLLELLPRFPHNTFYHRAVATIFSTTILHSNKDELVPFIKATKVAAFLLQEEVSIKDKKQQKQYTPEYVPFLHLIGRALKKQAEKYLEIQELLETSNDAWLDYQSMIGVEEDKEKLVNIEQLKGQNSDRESTGDEERVDAGDEADTGIVVDDLILAEDVDLDSSNDNLDYRLDKIQLLVSKKDIENFSVN